MELVDPTYEGDVAPNSVAPRPASLEGRVLGLLSNGKAAVEPFLDHVEHLVRLRWRVADVIRRTKPNYSAPAPADLITELVGWDAVLTGVGD